MLEHSNVTDLSARTEYERFVLEEVLKILGRDIIPTTIKLEYPDSKQKRGVTIRVSDVLCIGGDYYKNLFEGIFPLFFVATFKLFDSIVEFFLEVYTGETSKYLGFSVKKKKIERDIEGFYNLVPENLKRFIGKEDIIGLYDKCYKIRNVIVHRSSFKVFRRGNKQVLWVSYEPQDSNDNDQPFDLEILWEDIESFIGVFLFWINPEKNVLTAKVAPYQRDVYLAYWCDRLKRCYLQRNEIDYHIVDVELKLDIESAGIQVPWDYVMQQVRKGINSSNMLVNLLLVCNSKKGEQVYYVPFYKVLEFYKCGKMITVDMLDEFRVYQEQRKG